MNDSEHVGPERDGDLAQRAPGELVESPAGEDGGLQPWRRALEGVQRDLGALPHDLEGASDGTPRQALEDVDEVPDAARQCLTKLLDAGLYPRVTKDLVGLLAEPQQQREEGRRQLALGGLHVLLEDLELASRRLTERLSRAAKLGVELLEDEALRIERLTGLDHGLDLVDLLLGEGDTDTAQGGHALDGIVDGLAELNG